MLRRPRRNRFSPGRRALSRESSIFPEKLIAPLFIVDGKNRKEPLSSLPGVYRFSPDEALKECEALMKLGIQSVDLFPILNQDEKDFQGSKALDPQSPLVLAVQKIKRNLPDMCLFVDLALDPYTIHGHDGLVNEKGHVLNDPTVKILEQMALLYGSLGVDYVAPSDMMDGRIRAIRTTLDKAGFEEVGILSYAVKYASSFYAPFRDTVGSHLKQGDKKGYQMDPANVSEALLEASLDEAEGADLLLVKPALPYLDVLQRIRQQTHLPLGAYHVSGEYAMLKAAHERGWIDFEKALVESIQSIFRAGASFILTYGAKEMGEIIQRKNISLG